MMKRSPLPSQADIKRLLDYNPDTGIFIRKLIPELNRTDKMINARFAGKEAGNVKTLGYRVIMIESQLCMAHRLAWLYVHGVDPGDLQVDHINRNLLDNRIANLRLATASNNKANTAKPKINNKGLPTKNSYKGAYQNPNGTWHASIKSRGRVHNLGDFKTEKEAAIAYNKKAVELHGQFALINKI